MIAEKIASIVLIIGLLISPVNFTSKDLPDYEQIIIEMVVEYANNGSSSSDVIEGYLDSLEQLDPDKAAIWRGIMNRWEETSTVGVDMNEGILPSGLPETGELCIVVLGFELNPDGSMKDELIERLNVALASAMEYPNALIICTGGPTAGNNPEATEAEAMARWLIDNGVGRNRVIAENRSMSTAQNAIYTYQILQEYYPKVSQIALITSDYHMPVGVMLFEAQAALIAGETGQEQYTVVSNAAYFAPTGQFPLMWQAMALVELASTSRAGVDYYY